MKRISLKLSKEFKYLIWIIIILTIIFAFNDKKESFILSSWLYNFLKILILSIITILTFKLGHILAGRYYETKTKESIWLWRHFGFVEKARFPIKIKLIKKYITIPPLPIGIIIAILVTLISNGYSYFTAISTFDISPEKRVGRRFLEISEFEVALISFFGLLANLFLIFIFKIIGVQQGMLINQYFILWNLLPISNLSGSYIFYGSKSLYIFSLVFLIGSIILISYLSILATIALSLILAIILIIIFFYFREYKGRLPKLPK